MLEKIGKYEVSEQIGVGGFGAVYRGRDPFIKRTVAIKTCQVNDDEIKHRFFREAELAGNLHHRHITTIYDFGVENGIPYIVQEFLTGEDLDKKIKRGDPIPVTRKIEILMAIADGLAYAHNASIVHRDVKPANVRILEDGTVKVMDFGIAKSLQSESNLTQTGITLGTSAYLAPEQIRGEPIDRRTDIFALGVLAYELLTYRKPFRGEHLSTVLYKILNDTPEPIGTLVQDAPPALIAAVGRAMAKSADDRYPTMDAFRKDLQAVHRELSGLSGTYPAFTGDTVRTLRPDEDLETTLATPSSGVAGIRSNITPPSGALARVPAPSDATPTSASISGARPPLELVNFRDPTSDPANEDTVRRTTGFAEGRRVSAGGREEPLGDRRRDSGGPRRGDRRVPLRFGALGPGARGRRRSDTRAGAARSRHPRSSSRSPSWERERRRPRPRTRCPRPPLPSPRRRSRRLLPRSRRNLSRPSRPRASRCSSRRFRWRRSSSTERRSAPRSRPGPSRSKRVSTRVRLEAADFPPYEKKFRVGPKSQNRVHYQFPVSMLVIQAPGWAGARVLVDGKYRGSLPDAARLKLPPGTYNVTLSREGSNPVTEKIDVPEGAPKTWNAPPPSPAPAGGQ